MNGLQYAEKKVFLWQSSPVMGPFNAALYPFVIDPLLTLDDILCKALVLYGPTQSFKTVFLQIALAYLLDMRRKSVLAVAQTDDDADDFARIKLIPFLERIWSLVNTTKKGRSGQTLASWLWANHELIISGPGSNAQESKSVAYLITDEAHRWCVSNPGALTALRNRMGDRWDRMEIHGTTAADAGTEIDILYHQGQQSEWHLRCVHCDKLIWPLWRDASRAFYNGKEVFQWKDSQSETETLDSIVFVCPHCDKPIPDTRHNRIDMDEGAQYVPFNASADPSVRSFRWNAFAPRWKPHRDMLAKYLSAIHSAKLGELKPYEDWVKKQEVRSWTGEYPMLGDSTRGRNYMLGDVKIEVVESNHFRTCSADQQEKGGFHLKVQIDEWDRDGKSKRLLYDPECATYAEMEEARIRYGVMNREVKGEPKCIATAIDYGQGMREREIFAACANFKWLAMKSSDVMEFAHIIQVSGQMTKTFMMPYSEPQMQSATVGTKAQGTFRGKGLPPGFCVACTWSKPTIYGIFYALKNGDTEREYAIATDIHADYISELHSYTPSFPNDAKTHVPKPILWVKTAPQDHSWVTSCQSLILAIMAGFFPMAKREIGELVAK